jgi:hypothetical protein
MLKPCHYPSHMRRPVPKCLPRRMNCRAAAHEWQPRAVELPIGRSRHKMCCCESGAYQLTTGHHTQTLSPSSAHRLTPLSQGQSSSSLHGQLPRAGSRGGRRTLWQAIATVCPQSLLALGFHGLSKHPSYCGMFAVLTAARDRQW